MGAAETLSFVSLILMDSFSVLAAVTLNVMSKATVHTHMGPFPWHVYTVHVKH